MKLLTIIVIPYTILLTFLGLLGLTRVTAPEIYLISVLGFSLSMILAYIANDYSSYIVSLSVAYVLMSLSWPLASRFTNLLRGDVYHYYPFTRYIYELGTFSGASEKIFGVYVPHWPAWHVELTVLARVLGIELFHIVQIGQAFTTVPLTLLIAMLFSKLCNEGRRCIKYLTPLFLCFISFTVFTNTNPVPRSFAYLLTFLALYITITTILKRKLSYVVLLSLILSSLILTHPYNATITPLIILIFISVLIITGKFRSKGIPLMKNLYIMKMALPEPILYGSLIGLSLNILWITYSTRGTTYQFANYIQKILNMVWFRWEPKGYVKMKIKGYEGWVKTTEIQHIYFRTHPIEPYITKLVWICDILAISLAIAGWLLAVFSKRFSNDKRLKLPALMAFSTFLIFLINAFIIVGYPDRAFVASLPLVASFASILIASIPKHSVRRTVACALILTYTLIAALSLGVRTYQASFIWSSRISFEDKGMPTTHAIPIMDFVNKYGKFNSYEHIVADDPMARILIKDIRYYIRYVEQYRRFPEKPSLILDNNAYNTLVIVMRDFKPCYWTLRSVTWGLKSIEDINSLITELRERVNSTNLVYNDGVTKAYFK